MASLFLVSLLLLVAPAVHVVGQQGFLSIDCGLDDKYSGYTDPDTGIIYVSDGAYTDAGENLVVAAAYQADYSRPEATLRSFPSGVQNCYALPTEAGAKYLIRLLARYGNYDGKNDSSSMEFDLYLGSNYWDTVYVRDDVTYELVFLAWAGRAPVCLVNTGRGAPFASVVELRKLPGELYPPVTAVAALNMYTRINMGAGTETRFPNDQYDRFWFVPDSQQPQWRNLSSLSTIQPDASFLEPSSVLQTAVTVAGNGTRLNAMTWDDSTAYTFMVFLHFADFQSTQLRQFDIFFNGNKLGTGGMPMPYSPSSLAASCVYSSAWYRANDGNYRITLVATAPSALPPMLNALEVYTLVPQNNSMTFSKDFDAIMAIKLEYGVKKDWMGDPCFPPRSAWDGVKCRNTTDNILRIISLDLSNSHLGGVISSNFTLLTALENLDLSYNNLSGLIPDSLTRLSSLRVLNLSGNDLSGDSLCKNYTGSLVFRHDSDGYKCNIAPGQPNSPLLTKAAIIAISVVVPVLVLFIFLLACFICRAKRKPNEKNISKYDPARDPPKFENTQGSRKSHVDNLPNIESRRFTYKELEKFSNNFERLIGQGGFGPVYYGRLEDNTEVAVKMRSESASHGLDQFLRRNIVSLIGYCWEEDHLALIYEYMSQGSIFDHLRGKNDLNWGTRVRVALEAAQGLDYLHKGCSPPIIHRDVKSANILLNKNLQAKIADLGLSKTYLHDAQSHISVTAAGTAGYMDPQYYLTGRLTESSDVYSFGIVLLEVATGEPPMVPGYGHIVPRVQQMIATGDISSVADARLGGAYDISSMWKLVDTAMACTAESAAQRPTMATVVAQLKESLALEEAREKDISSGLSRGSEIPSMESTFRPMAR